MPQLTLQTPTGDIQYQSCTQVKALPPAMQGHFMCLHLAQGTLEVSVDSETALLQAGDLCLIPPFTRHSLEAGKDLQLHILTFTPNACPEVYSLLNQLKLNTPRLPREQVPPLVTELLRSITDQISHLGVYSRTEFAKSYTLPLGRSNYLQMYLSLLLLELIRAIPTSHVSSRDIAAMERVLRYCTANYSQELSRPTVARACDVTVATVTQTFHQLGTTFREYINDQRLTRAYQLLTTSKKPITDIIYDCGYTNQGTFNKNFLAKYGVTPRAVRQPSDKPNESIDS